MTDPARPEPASLAFLRDGLEAADRALARRAGAPLVACADRDHGLVVARREGALEIRWTGTGQPGPLVVDFLSGRMARRWRTATRKQALPRSIGLHRGRPSVLDATAGLGRDALTLAVLGCRVLAVERHPVLSGLFSDGLRRAGADPELAQAVQRITLEAGDAREVMVRLPPGERPDCVYLDPMYSHTGSAQVKNETQILRALVPAVEDPELLTVALACARRRVVVKRHPGAPPLGPAPDHVVAGSRVRYHVYLVP